jgi:homoaconitase/3-isopropylmalate dehydratase large subunit
MGTKLGIEVPAEILALKDSEAMSGALVELAVGMGKSETEIAAALG